MNIVASFGGIVGPMAVGYVASGSNPATSFSILGYSLFVGAARILVLIALNQNRAVAPSPVLAKN